jgi:membrane protease YdiL (CAAX protease family)
MTEDPDTGAAIPQGDARLQPGWPEIIVGLVVLAIVGYGGGAVAFLLDINPVVKALVFTALSGVAGLAGFAAAMQLRIRDWGAFGVRKTSMRWLATGIVAGLVATAVRTVVVGAFVRFTGVETTVQDTFAFRQEGGVLALVLAMLFLGVLTPIGEEFLFRGVVTKVLLRYGAFVGVVGSTLIFALSHGVNYVFVSALVAGLFAGEIFRRSGSVWPSVMVHVVYNLPVVPAIVLKAVH